MKRPLGRAHPRRLAQLFVLASVQRIFIATTRFRRTLKRVASAKKRSLQVPRIGDAIVTSELIVCKRRPFLTWFKRRFESSINIHSSPPLPNDSGCLPFFNARCVTGFVTLRAKNGSVDTVLLALISQAVE
jgi:hypothetical protein